MYTEIQLMLSPENAGDINAIKHSASKHLHLPPSEIGEIVILKRSIDARSKHVKIQLKIAVYPKGVIPKNRLKNFEYPSVENAKRVIIIGAGPAGLFAALKLISLGIKPVILERGKDVRERRRDLAAINKEHIVNPDSNYCFGEGGAGTYSDGKLYTRSNKRGNVESILNTLVAHGAPEDILVDAHPHIGTNKLPKIIISIRETILNHGGEIHFNSRVNDLILNSGTIKGVTTISGDKYEGEAVILATGHSARDIFELLHRKNILIEAKPFAMGVRAEHPQNIIDSVQYHCPTRGEYLPPASYSFVHQANGRGVYSFCMCPGGIIAPCATSPGEVVTNGWSPSKRNNPFANSGIVVEIRLEDIPEYHKYGVFSGLRFQQELEKMAFEAGGKTQTAPAQRLADFANGKLSSTLPDCSYQPGIVSAPLHELLPKQIGSRLREGFMAFGKKMHGYFTNEAVVVGVESRTSSPIRIPRDKDTLEHPQIKGFYPCGEGAGYAGGIVSAAIDGEKCAEMAGNIVWKMSKV